MVLVRPIDNSSPLHVASRNGHSNLVIALISVSPAMCFVRDTQGLNPVHVAVVKGHIRVIDELLRALPLAIRERVGGGGGGESIMHLCIKHNQLEALKLLARVVSDSEMMNVVDGEGNTLLHLAVR